MVLRALDVCAGAGGLALGLDRAGFGDMTVLDADRTACDSLNLNRPTWKIIQADITNLSTEQLAGRYDLIAGGLPSPLEVGSTSFKGVDAVEWDGNKARANVDWNPLDVPAALLRIIRQLRPSGVLIENVKNIAEDRASGYRSTLVNALVKMGYQCDWQILQASEFGLPQLRPRFILVALRPIVFKHFSWPRPWEDNGTVGALLADLMAYKGWQGADWWVENAQGIAPTLVGGSSRRGGPDLGPRRAKDAWAKLGVNASSIADESPTADDPVRYSPRLTLEMVARLQGFPDGWKLAGGKTAQYRLLGRACPPPLAQAVGKQIADAINSATEIE